MKPDYKNWFPKGMVYGIFTGAAVCIVLFLVLLLGSFIPSGTLKTFLLVIFGIASVVILAFSAWGVKMHNAFSYDGTRQMSKQIIEGIANRVEIPSGGSGLDIGCGSGALAIAVAKRNPEAKIVGVDRWGKDYASFSKTLCENNAKAEGVSNVAFTPGNALALDFEDETFDAVFSNYVYHNITGHDRQEILLETLRVLKKGGTFVIHDIFSKHKYGDMDAFLKKLKEMGYEKAELISTTDGMFMSKREATWMILTGSALLVGKK